jgi:hypothetical protein
LASQKKADSSDNNDGNTSPTQEAKGAIAWLNRNYWWPVWVPLVMAGGAIAIFWKQISEWWNSPKDLEGEESETKDEEE